MKIFGVLCLFTVLSFNSAFPRPRYYPRAYMIGGSYYANPRYVRQGPGYEYIPPGQMTTMVLGDTVATNTFSGPGFNPPQTVLSVPNVEVDQIDQVAEQVTEKQQPLLVPIPELDSINETEPQEEHPEQPGDQETLFSLEEATTEAAVVSTTRAVPIAPSRAPSAGRKVQIGKAKKPATTAAPQPAEEEDEEDDGVAASWPFGGAGKAGIPNYNAFFPIFIGGSSPSGRSRTRSTEYQEGGYPGSATAIANSFSTGKGGVASSHATSFGDPYVAAMLRNSGLFNFRTKSSKKPVVVEEED